MSDKQRDAYRDFFYEGVLDPNTGTYSATFAPRDTHDSFSPLATYQIDGPMLANIEAYWPVTFRCYMALANLWATPPHWV